MVKLVVFHTYLYYVRITLRAAFNVMLVLMCCMRRGSTVVKQLLQEDIARHKEKVQSLSDSADAFARQNHFMASELLDRAKRIAERYIFLSPKISSSCWIITTFARLFEHH